VKIARTVPGRGGGRNSSPLFDEYLMIKELAQEQEITTGKVNTSSISKQTGYDQKTIQVNGLSYIGRISGAVFSF